MSRLEIENTEHPFLSPLYAVTNELLSSQQTITSLLLSAKHPLILWMRISSKQIHDELISPYTDQSDPEITDGTAKER